MDRAREAVTVDEVRETYGALRREVEQLHPDDIDSTGEAPPITADEAAAVLRRREQRTPPGGLAKLTRLVALVPLFFLGCAELPAILGAAAPVVASGVGAYEQAVRAEAAAKGVPTSDPAVLAAIETARKADAAAAVAAEKRDKALAAAVASARAEERQHAAEVAAALAKLGTCPACPACSGAMYSDGGAPEGGR